MLDNVAPCLRAWKSLHPRRIAGRIPTHDPRDLDMTRRYCVSLLKGRQSLGSRVEVIQYQNNAHFLFDSLSGWL